MSYNELERVGYDSWKLSNRDDEMSRLAGKYGMVNYFLKREKLGTCPCCSEHVYNNELFVEDEKSDEEIIYHYSCYNYMVAEKSEKEE